MKVHERRFTLMEVDSRHDVVEVVMMATAQIAQAIHGAEEDDD